MNRLRVRYERDARVFTPVRERERKTTRAYLGEHILLILHGRSVEQLLNHRQIKHFASNSNTNSRRGLNRGYEHLSALKHRCSPTLLFVEKIPYGKFCSGKWQSAGISMNDI